MPSLRLDPAAEGRGHRSYAWFYDALTGDSFRPGEEDFYRAVALRSGGPVLEPACGTGRVLAVAYAAGVAVNGQDAEAAMLDLARRRLDALRQTQPALAQVPCELRAGRISELHAASGQGAILLPLDGFRLLLAPDEQRAFLAAARRLLRPGGLLALDLTLGVGPRGDLRTKPVVGPDGGTTVARFTRRHHRGLMYERGTYWTRWPDQPTRTEVSWDRYRIVEADELADLLAAAGFRVHSVSSDFLGTPWVEGDGWAAVVAQA